MLTKVETNGHCILGKYKSCGQPWVKDMMSMESRRMSFISPSHFRNIIGNNNINCQSHHVAATLHASQHRTINGDPCINIAVNIWGISTSRARDLTSSETTRTISLKGALYNELCTWAVFNGLLVDITSICSSVISLALRCIFPHFMPMMHQGCCFAFVMNF